MCLRPGTRRRRRGAASAEAWSDGWVGVVGGISGGGSGGGGGGRGGDRPQGSTRLKHAGMRGWVWWVGLAAAAAVWACGAAGEHTSEEHPSTVHGAFISGRREVCPRRNPGGACATPPLPPRAPYRLFLCPLSD